MMMMMIMMMVETYASSLTLAYSLHYFASGRSAKHCNQRVCVYAYLFVYLSTQISKKRHAQISPSFLYMLPGAVAVTRSSSDGSTICYVLPVLWMTSCFHIIQRIGRIRDTAYVSSSLPDGGTGGEVCRLRLHLV